MEIRLVAKTEIEPSYISYLLEEIGIPKEYGDIIKKPEGLIAYIARVSSPNQTNEKYANLIRYCMKHGHVSILEMCNVIFEIETNRGIAPQILRHWTFSFQEFSQRYSAVDSSGIEIIAARRQDQKNRQNSIDDLPQHIKDEWEKRQHNNWKNCFDNYKWALDNDIAKEVARFVLPLNTKTRLFMNGTLRSWVHYINVRADPSTQKEHRDIAVEIRNNICKLMPIIAEASNWVQHQE